jgi:Tfp pilus assembly protein PilF
MTHIFAMVCCFFAFFVANPAQNDTATRSFAIGNDAANEGRYDEAIENYREAIINVGPYGRNDIFLAKTYSNIGVCQYRLDRFDDAVSSLNTAIRISNGTYARAHYALGMTYLGMGQNSEAESSLRKSLRLERNDGEAWFDLAVVSLLKNDRDEAENAFRRSLRHGTIAQAEANNDLGVLLAGKGRWDDAEEHFTAAVRASHGSLAEAVKNLELCKRTRTGGDMLIASLTLRMREQKRKQI